LLVTKTSSPSARRRGRPTPKRKDRRWIWALVIVGIVLIVGLVIARQISTGTSEIAGVETFSNVPQGHQEGQLSYPQTPPAGGVHNPAWLNCGMYDQPVPNENAVHSQEHGAVWITYRPDLAASDIEQLRGLVRGQRYGVLSPYPDLPAPVVASAWGVQLKADGVADLRLPQFIAKYAQGPQTPELGAPCTGGIGTPSSR
jgi:hypothetical protein